MSAPRAHQHLHHAPILNPTALARHDLAIDTHQHDDPALSHHTRQSVHHLHLLLAEALLSVRLRPIRLSTYRTLNSINASSFASAAPESMASAVRSAPSRKSA